MSKLWQKNKASKNNVSKQLSKQVETFTVGRDADFDLLLAPHDVRGSIAHVLMLGKVKLLRNNEVKTLVKGLEQIAKEIDTGKFKIEPGIEDVHSQVEHLLTRRLGPVGKKIHMARSRNDQVLLDLKLYLRAELTELAKAARPLALQFLTLAEKHKKVLIPGYTHFQVAMPSSFGLWFSAYAEALADDLIPLHAAYRLVNQNPLGSAAGYGSSFPIDREMTTKLLGFENIDINVVYAQMTRGRSERIVANALANIADTLSKMAMDSCLYLSQNFGFFSFPSELTTGSSIMPHKKNPDVFELVRAKCNRIKALPNEIALQTTNLPSGYHRDFQIIKEHLFPAFQELKNCMDMMGLMFNHVTVKDHLLQDPKYRYIFSVEEVNERVLKGKTFRDAYVEVGLAIESGEYDRSALNRADYKKLKHTHLGSLGNLGLPKIRKKLESNLKPFRIVGLR